MNYLKQLWQQFHINDQLSSQQQQQKKQDDNNNSPQQSGQFQVIQLDDLVLDQDENNCKKYQNNSSLNQKNQPINHFEQKSSLKPTLSQLNKNKNDKVYNNLQQQCAIKKKLENQYMIIELDPLEQSQKLPQLYTQNYQQPKQSRSASTIQMDEYYMIVDSQQLTKTFQSQQQWSQFYQKINYFNNKQNNNFGSHSHYSKEDEELMGGQKLQNIAKNNQNNFKNNKKQRISLTLKELNSILQILPEHLHRRQQYWSKIAIPTIPITFKSSQLANKKDPKNLQKNVDKIMQTLVPSILYQIAQKQYKPIQNIQDQLQKWQLCLVKVLTMYGANDRQIGYSKGLEYLVVGLMVSIVIGFQTQKQKIKTSQMKNLLMSQQKHHQFYCRIQTHFKYLMFTKNLRNMYFPGTPKLYPEIQSLTQLMRLETPLIYQMLQEMKVQFIKLFINYYKTFLLYKIKNPEVIRKIMELLIIYGLDLVRIVVIRILARQEKKILEMRSDEDIVLKYIAQQLVGDYFGMVQAKQVTIKCKNLFVLQNGL